MSQGGGHKLIDLHAYRMNIVSRGHTVFRTEYATLQTTAVETQQSGSGQVVPSSSNASMVGTVLY